MKVLDTQIISYKFKKSKDIDVRNKVIPSIVAIEFLLMQTDRPYAANYYIPSISRYHLPMVEQMKIDHPFSKKSTDSLIFDFGQLHKPFAIFSNYNISELINSKNAELFDKTVHYLEKRLQKDLKKKVRFIFDSDITCEPIVESDVETAYELLDNFISKHNSKGNFRNTWNDILILSKAKNLGIPLLTEDKLLNRFASENYNANIIENNGILDIDFSRLPTVEKKPNKESKGYINRGWEYKMKKNYAP